MLLDDGELTTGASAGAAPGLFGDADRGGEAECEDVDGVVARSTMTFTAAPPTLPSRSTAVGLTHDIYKSFPTAHKINLIFLKNNLTFFLGQS